MLWKLYFACYFNTQTTKDHTCQLQKEKDFVKTTLKK